jgi:PAS domain S-box-containing protein
MWIREQEKQFGKERLYHQLFHAAPNGMGIVDLNGRWLEVNSALCRLTGYSEKELLYSHFRAVPHAMDGEADAFYMERMLYHKIGQYQFEKSYIHKMGHLIHVIFSISLLRDKYENPLYYIVQLQDIGERKHMEERLFAYKEMYSAFIKNTTDAVAILDSEGHVLEVNEAYSRIFGWTREEVIGKRFPATPEECMQDAEYLLEKAVSGGVVQKVETVKRRKDGTWIDVSISMSPIRDSMGRVVAVSAMARDMTLQNKLWQTARESEDVFIRLMENSPEPFMISRDGIWVYGNNAALQLLGAAGKDQVIGKSVYDFIHPQGHETVRRRLACAEKGNIKGLIEQKMIRLDGTVIHVETVTIPAMFEGKPSIHTVIRDVTERKKAEEVLRTSDKLKAAGQMAAGIAHEIRNPLTAIKGFIQLAEWRLPDKVEYFSIIKEEIERIERITSELLMLAKPNPGKVQKTDIRQILQGVKALLETQAITRTRSSKYLST